MEFPSTRALDGLDLRVPSGVTGLVGANGAGKTTLISLVLGLLETDVGHDPRARSRPIASTVPDCGR